MESIERLRKFVTYAGREVIDADHPLSVEAAGGREILVFEGHRHPGDVGLIIGAPSRPRSDLHGHHRVAAVLAGEQPLQKAATRVGLDAYEAAMAGEGVGHD